MSSLSFWVFLTGAFVPLLVIVFIWQNAGWSWKVRPIVPMLLGLFVLVAAFAADLYLFNNSGQIHRVLQNPPKQVTAPQMSLLVDAAAANDQLAKVLELITIPLGVALVASALMSKSELEFKRLISDYNSRVGLCRDARARMCQLEQEFEESLAAGERGQVILDKWDRLKAGRFGLVQHETTLRQQFKSLIDEKFVAPPDHRRERE